MNTYTKEQTIISTGDAFEGFYIIMEGNVRAIYDFSYISKEFLLKKGDVIGIFNFGAKEHSFTYKTATDCKLLYYPLKDFTQLTALLSQNKDLAYVLSLSLIQNSSKLIHLYSSLRTQQKGIYQYLESAWDNYQKLVTLLELPIKALPGMERLQPYVSAHEKPAFWLEDYHLELKKAVLEHNPLFSAPSFVAGILTNGVSIIRNFLYYSESLLEYLQDIGTILINDNSLDLFDLYTDLMFRSKSAKKDTALLTEKINKMISILTNLSFIDKELVEKRIRAYQSELQRDHSYDVESKESMAEIKQKLTNSLELILDYANTGEAARKEWIHAMELYRKLPDKNTSDKNADTIRRQLTALFNKLYMDVFLTVVKDPTPPHVVMMFLHFGYLDLELAGLDNAAILYSIAKNYQADPAGGVYTIYEWLLAIYKGDKQASRNELSQDYASYVNTLRSQGKIAPNAVTQMLNDTTEKVKYELENMFPAVNKVTNGHIVSFCPIFIEENVIKDLNDILVTPYKIKEALNQLLAVDFSAFYRSYLFVDEKTDLRENVMIDVRPDFILMPNIGTNGVCWQEIEGMQRSTPGRMMVSAFHAESLEHTMMEMVGDFRWEMCRRIQGMRWNDVTEHSLTSEYYDYAMFYNKNRALSQDAKAKVKLALARARNNYKNLFIMDYCNWIIYESKGGVKLNKVARQIFSTYCPFPSSICETVSSNGAFTECIHAYTIKKKQQLHHLQMMEQKYRSMGRELPEPIANHMKLISV